MKFFSMVFIFCFFCGCAVQSSRVTKETNECVHFKSLMTDLLEPAALNALQEACINSKTRKK